MFTRIVECRVKPDKRDEFNNKLRNDVLPILQKQPGFVDLIGLSSESDAERVVSVSFWKSKEDAERYHREHYQRIVDTLKLIFTPFLPFTSQRLHELLGYEGWLAGPLEFREIEEEDASRHTILTGDYTDWVKRWEPSDLAPGQKLREPEPLFKKLDPGIVDDELRRLGDQ